MVILDTQVLLDISGYTVFALLSLTSVCHRQTKLVKHITSLVEKTQQVIM